MVERERQVPNAKDPETPSSDDRQHNRQGALLAQQTMDEDDTATQETVPSKHVGRMQQIIREGMALLSSSSDFASPDMIALIEKAHTLWAELGEKEATAQVLALQGTMAEGEAAMLQQMVDMVVHQRPLEEGKEGEKTREEEKAREGEVHGVEVDVSGVPVVEEAGGQGERHSSEEPHDAPQRPSSDPSDAVHCHRCSSTNAVSDFEMGCGRVATLCKECSEAFMHVLEQKISSLDNETEDPDTDRGPSRGPPPAQQRRRRRGNLSAAHTTLPERLNLLTWSSISGGAEGPASVVQFRCQPAQACSLPPSSSPSKHVHVRARVQGACCL